jgi:hypothetical protein
MKQRWFPYRGEFYREEIYRDNRINRDKKK